MDDELVETGGPTAGERLRAAREEAGLSLEDVAAQTRIPRRHLEAIEQADWTKLPAPTYSLGFARSYATVVGLDRTEIADQLRAEMGGQRPTATTSEVFEPADPRRTMPRALVIGAIVAVIAVVLIMSWLSRRSLEQPDDGTNTAAAATAPAPQQAPTPTPAAAGQPVVLTAVQAVWFQVSEKGGASLFSGTLQPGQTYAVPATATAPVLKTGKPEALKITVGNNVAPPVGPPATTVTNVSLLGADLLKAGAASAPAAATLAPAPVAAKPSEHRAAVTKPRAETAPPPAAAPSGPATTPTNNTTN